MPLKKIFWDKKNAKVHFTFKIKHVDEVTEYVVDEWHLEGFLERIISDSWFIEKKIDGEQVFPEVKVKKTRSPRK